jgi:NAD(P)-dependent dehydrogenase (short-subunit alcohol dehydrogenase family)
MSQVVIVTGGTRGIGFAISKAFLEAGHKVVLNFLRDKKQANIALKTLQAINENVILVQGDITSQHDRENIITRTMETFHGLDSLINNAGLAGKHDFLKEPEDAFKHILEANLTGPVCLAQSVARHMIEQNTSGSIINICSTAAYSPSSGSTSYCAAKAGLLMATKSMALNLGSYNIRVNSITPGAIKTDMSRHAWDNPDVGPALAKKLPLRRCGAPEEIAGAALYLCSDQARYTTGTDIVIDGGWLLQGIR